MAKINDELYSKLKEPRRISIKIKSINAEIEHIRGLMLPGAIRYDRERVDTSPEDKMQKLFAQLDEKERARDEMLNDLFEAVKVVKTYSELIPDDREKAIVLMRFNACLEWDEIAERLGYAKRHVIRLYNKGLEELNNG
jgi:DNA-directed RNA polymerase specialized sigma subunit